MLNLRRTTEFTGAFMGIGQKFIFATIVKPPSVVTPEPKYHLAEWPTEEFANLGRMHIKRLTSFGNPAQCVELKLTLGLQDVCKFLLKNAIFLG